MWFLPMQVVQKSYTKLKSFFKKSTLANIGRLDNKKNCKIWKKKTFFFHSALLRERFMSEVPMLDGQITGRGWGSHWEH